MNIFKASDRAEWRQWLNEHFETEKEVWFILPTKAAGEESISYNDMVEEALCFGWIDSTIKHIDPTHRAQHITPRNPKSTYSRPNIERLIWLDGQGMIHPKVKPLVLPIINEPYIFPEDILAEIKKDPETWANFERFSDSYRRIRVAYIDAARKRPDEFRKRLANFIGKTKANKLIKGYGGIEKYYK